MPLTFIWVDLGWPDPWLVAEPRCCTGCGTAKLGPVHVGDGDRFEVRVYTLSSSGRAALGNPDTRLAVQVLVV